MLRKRTDFFIVGASRSGTTSLFEYLKKSPSIFMPKIKEPGYFSKNIKRPKPINNLGDYLSLYEEATEGQLLGDASTRYLIDKHSAENIKKFNSNAKIIIILRNPIERAFSSYLYYTRKHKKNSFRNMINYSLKTSIDKDFLGHIIVNGGFYYDQVHRFLQHFEDHYVKIIFFEKFIIDTYSTMNEIFDFLLVDNINEDISYEKYNQFKIPKNTFSRIILRFDDALWNLGIKKYLKFLKDGDVIQKKHLKQSKKPDINKDDRLFLTDLYTENMYKLSNILSIRLPWKDFNNF